MSRAALGPLLLLAAVTFQIVAEGEVPPSAVRHLYLVPSFWAALEFGARGGGVIGLVSGLLQAPFALPAVEHLGLVPQSVDGLVSMLTPLGFGWVVGRLADQSRGRAVRLRTVLVLQHCLSQDTALEERLASATEHIRLALGARHVAVVIGPDSVGRVIAGSPVTATLDERSAAAWVFRERRPLFVDDLYRDDRFDSPRTGGPVPVRGLLVPLEAGTEPLGVLAVERAAGFPAPLRAAAHEMAVHLALAVQNARLTLRQRRFTEELEQKVAAATARLQELDQAKTEFVSVVAHELRTPLTALQGFTELLISGRDLSPERASRFLHYVHVEAQRLGRIVGELLDLSRIESGRGPQLAREPLDLRELLERNIELFATQHPDHRFRWSACVEGPTLRGDRDAIDRILKNLISNAVKYSPGGGVVAVGAGPADDRPGMYELSVEDEGVGITARQLPRIFDKYVRVQNPETATVRGLGLGLALVRALAEAHGGMVEVDSVPGKGSKFRVLLPI